MPTLADLGELDAAGALGCIADVEARLVRQGLDFAEAVARSLPESVAPLPTEVTLALAGLALSLTHLDLRLPQDLQSLDGARAHAWDRVVLCLRPNAGDKWHDRRVLRALSGGDVGTVTRPAALLERCAAAEDPDLALLALRWSQDAVARCSLELAAALTIVEALATHGTSLVRVAAVRALNSPWLSGTVSECPVAIAKGRVRDDDDEVVMAALEVLATAGDATTLRRVARLHAPQVSGPALALLGRCGDADDLRSAIASDGSASCRREHIAQMHRRGLFPDRESGARLTTLFIADPGWSADDFNRVTFTIRDEVLAYLTEVGAEDPRWQRAARLLPGCEGSAEDMTAGELLCARLSGTSNVDNAVSLLEAAQEAPEARAEAACLAWLDRLPVASLRALSLHGGTQTTAALLERLERPLAFGSARRLALSTLWSIARDPAEVLARLDARELSMAQAARPPLDSEAIDRALARIPDADALRRFATLVELGASPDGERARALFRAAFLEGLLRRGPRRRPPSSSTVLERHARRFGSQQAACGRRAGRFGDRDAAAWLRSECLDWLTESLESDDGLLLVELLETLKRCGLESIHFRYVHRLWRHRDSKIRRAAMETLVSAHASGLTLSLCSLASAPDIRASRQALGAIAVFEADWAEPLAIEALGSPNMNLKKAATEALVAVGSSRAIPALIDWLARSDNRGLRSSLLAALEHIAGEATTGLLVDAFESAKGDRAAMLRRALDGRLTSAQLLSILRARRSAGPTLRQAVKNGDLTLADGNDVFARATHEGPNGRKHDDQALLDAFASRPFSRARARELIEALDGDVPLALVSSRLPEWAEWSKTLEGNLARRVGRVVLRAIAADDHAHASTVLRLAPLMQTRAERRAALATLVELASVDAETRHDALAVVRELVGVEPHARWRALVRLGGGTTRADLELCLADARSTGSAVQLLRAALSITRRHESLLHALSKATVETRDEALDALLAECPLGVTPPPPRPEARRHDDLSQAELLTRLASDDAAPEAARRLLDDQAMRSAWPQVLERYLDGALPLGNEATLAEFLLAWPSDPVRAERAAELVGFVPPHRRRAWIPAWLDGWSQDDAASRRALARVAREDIVAALAERRALDDERWFRVLDLCSVADTELAGLLDERLATEHVLFTPEDRSDEAEEDPLVEVHSVPALQAFVKAHRGQEAARAVGRLGQHGEEGIDALVVATKHADSLVRTVALRWLRRAAPEATRLDAALVMLRVERHKDLRRQLVRTVAHGRHEPAYPLLVELLFAKENTVAQATEEALLRLGPAIVPALHKAMPRTRPDRRGTLEALLERIAAADDDAAG